MNLNLSADQEHFLDTTRRFLNAESPLSLIRDSYELADGFTPQWWHQVTELGWTMLAVPETLGGISLSGHKAQDLAIVAEAMGNAVAPGPFCSTVLPLHALSHADRPESFAAVIAEVLAGEHMLAWAFGEPQNNWDSAGFTSCLQRDNSGWLLSGVKAYVEAGAQADSLLVTASSQDGLCQLLLPARTAGVRIVPCRSLDFVRRFATVYFDDVRIDDDWLVHRPATGSTAAEQQLTLALLLQCAETNGIVECAMNMTMEYMQDRYAFGRVIASYQALKHRLADMALHLHSCMAITDAAITSFDRQQADAYHLACVAKTYVAVKATEIMSDLVQMNGGIALTWEHDLHLYSRRVAVNRALYGTPEHYALRVQQQLAG